MSPDITVLYDTIRWEEKALLEAGKKKNVDIQMTDCKKLFLDLDKKTDGFIFVIEYAFGVISSTERNSGC